MVAEDSSNHLSCGCCVMKTRNADNNQCTDANRIAAVCYLNITTVQSQAVCFQECRAAQLLIQTTQLWANLRHSEVCRTASCPASASCKKPGISTIIFHCVRQSDSRLQEQTVSCTESNRKALNIPNAGVKKKCKIACNLYGVFPSEKRV